MAVTTGDAQNRSPDDAAMMKRFAGTWLLVSWTNRLNDGTVRDFSNVSGYLIYADTGHMCAVLMNRDRPRWTSERAPTVEEMKAGLAAPTDFFAYCSTVEVHAKEGLLLHHVQLGKSPNIVGRTLKRRFTLEGSRLTLQVDPPELTSPVVNSTLVWERAETK
jgi:hypothetical protein